MRYLTVFLLIFVLINVGDAWRSILRGRKKNGNLGEPNLSQNHKLPDEQWIEQPLDHFNPVDGSIWQQVKTNLKNLKKYFTETNKITDLKLNLKKIIFWQRYFVNKDFWKTNGPVFIMIGGEGPASAKWMVEGQWLEYAKQFGALCFQLEHRYYGKSHPTK